MDTEVGLQGTVNATALTLPSFAKLLSLDLSGNLVRIMAVDTAGLCHSWS